MSTLISDLLPNFEVALAQTKWAEQEIDKARVRSGETGRGRVWQAFALLRPTHARMASEFVYRAHCRELLDRVAAGADTKAGTTAEIAIAMLETSLIAPLNGPAAGLYFRVFKRAFPQKYRTVFRHMPRTVEDYERVFGERIDEYEDFACRKLSQAWRHQSVTFKASLTAAKARHTRRQARHARTDGAAHFVLDLRELCNRLLEGG